MVLVGCLLVGMKISGMIDESMDTEKMSNEPEPHEFRAKPAWQRLIIMLGGVTVNVILAFFIYVFAFMVWGDQYPPQKTQPMVFIATLWGWLQVSKTEIISSLWMVK